MYIGVTPFPLLAGSSAKRRQRGHVFAKRPLLCQLGGSGCERTRPVRQGRSSDRCALWETSPNGALSCPVYYGVGLFAGLFSALDKITSVSSSGID